MKVTYLARPQFQSGDRLRLRDAPDHLRLFSLGTATRNPHLENIYWIEGDDLITQQGSSSPRRFDCKDDYLHLEMEVV